MKKKQNYFKALFFLTLTALVLTTACKKDNNEEADSGSIKQLSKDEMTIQNATDEILNDVGVVLSGNDNKNINTLPCNVTVDTGTVVNDTITYTLTFNGNNCAGTNHRLGVVLVKKHINTNWINAGATVVVLPQTLKITRISTGKWVILNGTKTHKNVSGGLVSQLGNGTVTSVVREINGTINATFDDNTTRTWQIARKRTFTGTTGQIEFTHEGLGSADGYSNLVVWGINRNGENFYTQITQPILFKQTCSWNPCLGEKIHNIPSNNKKAVINFGYNNNQQLVSGNNCPTHYKLYWEKGTNSGTLYLPLP